MAAKVRKGQLVKIYPDHRSRTKIACYRRLRERESGFVNYTFDYFNPGEIFVVEAVRSNPQFDRADWSGMTKILHPQTGETFWLKRALLRPI